MSTKTKSTVDTITAMELAAEHDMLYTLDEVWQMAGCPVNFVAKKLTRVVQIVDGRPVTTLPVGIHKIKTKLMCFETKELVIVDTPTWGPA